MDILIKGMDMPKSCEDCPFTKKVCDIYFTDKKTGVKTPYHYVDSCSLTGSWFDPFSDDSPKPCPLVALPEHHGRLVDADTIADNYLKYLMACFPMMNIEQANELISAVREALKVSPTILEATE